MTYLRSKNTNFARMIDRPIKQLESDETQFSPGLQFLIFCGLFVGILFAANLIGIAIVIFAYGEKTFEELGKLNVSGPHFSAMLWIMQIIGTTLPIFVAPVIFACTIVKKPAEYLKAAPRLNWLLMLIVLVLMFTSTPLIEFLSNINQKMVLPPFLKWMRDSEDSAEKITAVMLQMNSVWNMIANVLVIGLLTAIVEEFMFRGVIQTIFIRWTKNTHAAVWITAILFSAFHIEFFGFLPRLLLGVLFGYFVAWSGSIWTGVWAHFINNGTDVVVTWLYQKKKINTNPDSDHIFNYQGYTISFIIVLILLFIYHYISSNKKTIADY
jgi:uncharacterized protein